MKVLLIEDNETIGGFLTDILKLKNYSVEWLKDGEDVELYFEASDYDIVLLDWMLPSTSGIEVIKRLRENHIDVPIIMLTAKSALEDKVEGLTTGADDYLTKPFEIDELEARMYAVIKRSKSNRDSTKKIGNVCYDMVTHSFDMNGESLDLTHKEFQLLELLFLNHTVSREMILGKVWNSDQFVGANNIDSLVHLLKKKLKNNETNLVLKSIRNVGYRLESSL